MDESATCSHCANTEAMVSEMKSKFDETISLLNEIKEVVGPTIESLKTSPVGKMMGL